MWLLLTDICKQDGFAIPALSPHKIQQEKGTAIDFKASKYYLVHHPALITESLMRATRSGAYSWYTLNLACSRSISQLHASLIESLIEEAKCTEQATPDVLDVGS